jgi:hypothetical protein
MASSSRFLTRRTSPCSGASPSRVSALPKCLQKRDGGLQADDNAASARAARRWNHSCGTRITNTSSMPMNIPRRFSKMSVRRRRHRTVPGVTWRHHRGDARPPYALRPAFSRSFPPAQRRNRHAKHVSHFANGNDPFHLVQNRTDSLRLHVYCSSPIAPQRSARCRRAWSAPGPGRS